MKRLERTPAGRNIIEVYFERTDTGAFVPSEHVAGAWDIKDQHIAPALGLLLHEVELDRDRRRSDRLEVARISYDILGTVPVEEFEIKTELTRPGRTVELVEAKMIHAGRTVVILRAWLLATRDTSGLAGSGYPPMPAPDTLEAWDPTTVWPGGFIRSAEVRRDLLFAGRARFWVRTPVRLLDEPVSPTARMAGLFDISNGMAILVDPGEATFPNVDLTAHLFRDPREGWLGFDTTVSFGPSGLGLTQTILHDETGPFGSIAQALTVRPS